MFRLLAILLIATSPGLQAAQAESITDEDLNFSLQLPEGFVADPAMQSRYPRARHLFVKHIAPDSDAIEFLIAIEPLSGTIGKQRLNEEEARAYLPSGTEPRLFTAQWGKHEIDVMQVEVSRLHGRVSILTAQVPLERRAIMVMIVGPVERRNAMQSVLDQVLAGLSGESNWDVSAEASSNAHNNPPPRLQRWMKMSLDERLLETGVGFAIVVVFAVVLWLIARKRSAHVVTGLSLLCFVVGFAFHSTPLGPIDGIGWPLYLVGLAGMIIAVIHYVRGAPPAVTHWRDYLVFGGPSNDFGIGTSEWSGALRPANMESDPLPGFGTAHGEIIVEDIRIAFTPRPDGWHVRMFDPPSVEWANRVAHAICENLSFVSGQPGTVIPLTPTPQPAPQPTPRPAAAPQSAETVTLD